MTAAAARIRPLPADAIAQIKSSTAITSLTGALLGLVSNSLDADARKVDITVDFPRGACTVEDNGLGILPAEFGEDGGLGRLHSQSNKMDPFLLLYDLNGNLDTSKYDDARPMYGRIGAFLFSLAAVSLVSITSRRCSNFSYCTITLHRSRVITRLLPAPPHQQLSVREHGTRVTVRDLFGNMPVRVKHRAVAFQGYEGNNKEWINLKRSIVALLLAWGRPVTVIAKDSDGNCKFVIRGSSEEPYVRDSSTKIARNRSFKMSSVRSILSQAAYISPTDWGTWVVTSARTITMTVRGFFSLQPAPSKHVQFISVGIHPITAEGVGIELYDSINRMFASSSFGVLEDKSKTDASEMDRPTKDGRVRSNGPTKKQLKGGRKGVDRWPMFHVQVDVHTSEQSFSTVNDDIITNERSLNTLIDVLGEMITQFLKEHHFRSGSKTLKRMAGITHRASLSSPSSAPTSLPLAASSATPVRAGNTKAVIIPQSGTCSGTKSPTCRTRPSAEEKQDTNNYNRKSKGQDNSKTDQTRIPSFSKPQRNGNNNMFGSWSRIKAGKGDMADVCAGLPTTKLCKQLMRSPPVSNTERVLEGTGAGKLPMTAALKAPDHAANGFYEGILRETSNLSPCTIPVGTSEKSVPQSSTQALLKEAEVEDRGAAADEVLIWTNPISKTSLAINARTGIAMPRRPHRPFSPPSAAGLSTTSGDSRPLCRRKPSSLLHAQKDLKKIPKADSWVGKFLETWDNPVFAQTEEAIPHVQMCEITNEAASKGLDWEHHRLQSGAGILGKLSKDALKDAEIIAQVDNKFILIKMEAESTLYGPGDGPSIDRRLLVLVDQHAADERCRIEELMRELCRPPASESEQGCCSLGYKSQIITTPLTKPITFPASVHESDMFKLHAGHLADWGILYDVVKCLKDPARKELGSAHRIAIKSLPPAIFERCKMEPAHLISLLRSEVWENEGKGWCGGILPVRQNSQTNVPGETSNSAEAEDREREEHGWLRRIGDCPQGILNMLNSRACRSAIMFNDRLSREQCQTLIAKLAQCAFPFQCAHGRPSMIPLVDLGGSGTEQLRLTAFGASGEYSTGGEEHPTFVEAFSRWKGI